MSTLINGIFGSAPSSTTGTGNTSSAGLSATASNNSSNGTSATNPNLPSWYNNFLQSLVPQYNQLSSLSSTPAIGQNQISQYVQGVNQQAGQATQQAMSQLAKAGALNSGRAAQTVTGIQLGKMNNINNYLAQVPTTNENQMFSQGASLLGQGMGFKAPYGQTNSNSNNSLSSLFNTSSNTSGSNTKQSNSGSGLLGWLGI